MMKRLLFAVIIVVGFGVTFLVVRHSAPDSPAMPEVGEAPPLQARGNSLAENPALTRQEHSVQISNDTEAPSGPGQRFAHAWPPKEVASDDVTAIKKTVDLLTSPETSFQEKQATWRRLVSDGKLDQVIRELEQHAANNSAAPEYPTALGQAYIHKIASAQDHRDRAILGLAADRSFDAAIQLDPSNWEARFFKASSMSYWPQELNKGAEVIQGFRELIEQQEAVSPRPEFAQSYVFLGKEYQKAGLYDYARQVWKRGTAFFPDNQTLANLAVTPP